MTLVTELDDSETGFVSVLKRKGEEIFGHILYKELILVPGAVFEIMLKVQPSSNSKCHSGSVNLLKVTYLQTCNYAIHLNQNACKCSRHSDWATGWMACSSNPGSGKWIFLSPELPRLALRSIKIWINQKSCSYVLKCAFVVWRGINLSFFLYTYFIS